MCIVNWLLARKVEHVGQWPLLLEYTNKSYHIFLTYSLSINHSNLKKLMVFVGFQKTSSIFVGIKYWNKNGNLEENEI